MYPEIAKKEGLCSMLAIPMIVKDNVIGVINIYFSNEHIFTDEEIKILQSVAGQAAVAIENTELTHEILETKEALETRKLVERAKGLLIKQLGISEQEAYNNIHKKSMNLRKSMKEIAQAIILALETK